MKDFDARWQACAERARKTPGREESVPFGFTSRVVARAYSRQEPSAEDVLGHLTFRMLAGAMALLLLFAVMEAPHFRESRPLDTKVEDAVGQLVWSL